MPPRTTTSTHRDRDPLPKVQNAIFIDSINHNCEEREQNQNEYQQKKKKTKENGKKIPAAIISYSSHQHWIFIFFRIRSISFFFICTNLFGNLYVLLCFYNAFDLPVCRFPTCFHSHQILPPNYGFIGAFIHLR